MVRDYLQRVELRTLQLLTGSSALFITVVVFTYLVWPEIKTHKQTQSTYKALTSRTQGITDLRAQINVEKKQLDQRQHQFHGDARSLSVEQTGSFVIDRLQKIAWKNNLKLISVEPYIGSTVEPFRELQFNVEITGDYFDFFAWLQAIARDLRFINITQYDIKIVQSSTNDSKIAVNLTIIFYPTENHSTTMH